MTCARCFRIALLWLLIPIAGFTQGHSELNTERALSSLDKAMRHSRKFIRLRQAHIDSLVSSADSAEAPFDTYRHIAQEYTSFNNDSALRYFELARESAPDSSSRRAMDWHIAALLPLSGHFERARLLYESIPEDSVDQSLLASYYESGRQMYSYIDAFSRSNSGKQDPELRKRILALQKELLEHLPRNSTEYKYNLGEYYFLTGSPMRSKVLLLEVMDHTPAESPLRARAAHHLAVMARDEGNEDAYIYYLAQSALADVSAATREVSSLQELGAAIGTRDVGRGHRYISAALENAVECGAAIRMVETSRIVPFIESLHEKDMRQWHWTILIIVAILIIAVIILAVVHRRLRLNVRRMRVLQNTLRQANKTKEVYISQFLSLCSIYMDKLNQFCKIANRKLAAGQADELYRMTKSGKFIEEQSREFYEVFDNAFLHIYPTFVADVNRLLRPDAQIELRDGELLNTDLRILAFIRLGIEDSHQIAQVLNYSLNTIYSYRNRLKGRAINRDSFEQDIAGISANS